MGRFGDVVLHHRRHGQESFLPDRGGDLLVFRGDLVWPPAEASIAAVTMMTMMYCIIRRSIWAGELGGGGKRKGSWEKVGKGQKADEVRGEEKV